MMEVLLDSNVLIDVLQVDPMWFDWSSNVLEKFSNTHRLVINPVVYAEVSIAFESIEDLDSLLDPDWIIREAIPYPAAFLAGKCFLKYKRNRGKRNSPLPDFFIGAHAAIKNIPLITRDEGRYRTYFPRLEIVSPTSSPFKL